MLGNDSVIIEL